MSKETPAGELLPCPFCGESVETDFIPEHHSYQIECSDCIGCYGRVIRDTEIGAIDAWNRRAADRELRRGDVAMPVVAWLYDWGIEGTHEVVEDWATQSHAEAHSKADGCRNIRPLVKQSDAQAALAAKDATHEKQLNAHKTLIQSLENQRTTLWEDAEKWAEAVKSLLSEREANAILTGEIEALTAERDHWKANHDAQVQRARLLVERTDMPVERVKAYEVVTAMTAERNALKVDAERLDWVALQDLSEFDMQFIFDAPHEGEYSVGTEYGTFYGLTLREAIDAAMGWRWRHAACFNIAATCQD